MILIGIANFFNLDLNLIQVVVKKGWLNGNIDVNFCTLDSIKILQRNVFYTTNKNEFLFL